MPWPEFMRYAADLARLHASGGWPWYAISILAAAGAVGIVAYRLGAWNRETRLLRWIDRLTDGD